MDPRARMSPVETSKATLRTRFQAYRTSLDPAERAARSRQILDRLATLPELRTAETVHAYWPMVESGEVDTRPLLRTLAAAGRRLVLPVVTSFEAGRPVMEHRCFEGEALLRTNRWGVEEPIGGETVPPGAIDVVLAPALGAACDGHRIGHGRGYYDAFLRTCPAPAVGLLYAATLVDAVPVEPHDIPLDVIVTEDAVLRPRVTSPPHRRTPTAV